MSITSIDNYRASQRIHPLSLLAQMSSRKANGCLKVSDGSTSWWIYLNNGELVHASNSVAPFERLERHLRQMNQDACNLEATVRSQVHQLFNTVQEQDIEWLNPPDYMAIRWLADKGYITVSQATILLVGIAKEVFETFLQVRAGVHEMVDCPELMGSPLLCILELRPLVESCQKQLRQGSVRQSSHHTSTRDLLKSGDSGAVAKGSDFVAQRSAELSRSPSHISPISNGTPERSLNVEGTTQGETSSSVNNLFAEREKAEKPLELGKSENLPFEKSSPSGLFRPSERSFSAPENRQTDSIFSNNLSQQSAVPKNSSPSQFRASATQSFDFRNLGMAASDQRGSIPTGSPPPLSSQTRNGLRSPSEKKTPSPNLGSKSNLLREPSVKIPQNPPLYRDKDKPEINQRSSAAKDVFRPSVGYPSSGRVSSPGSSKPQGEKRYKVACIDDSPMILHMIEAFLEDKSFAVIKINDPVRALMELMRAKPDIILLDITMPNLDGYELCALLRSRPDFRNTPIIMVTGSKGLIDRAKARLVKASGYLTKPFNQTQLLKMIFKLLK
ncbi:MAG: response regulator [Cyanobacteria bacterium P01_F01_bin.150]